MKSNESPRGTLSAPWGIDVSHHQGVIDWMRVKASGAEFAFLKASEGATFVDRQYKRNYARAKAAGLIVGAYHFFQPRIPVEAQVENFLRAVGKLEVGDLPPVLDAENQELWSGISRKRAVDLIIAWCQGIETKLGAHVQPILYISPNFAADVLGNDSRLKDYPLWLAHYTSKPTPRVPKPWSFWTFWQYTETGRVPGISGNVDIDRFNGDSSRLDALRLKAPQTERAAGIKTPSKPWKQIETNGVVRNITNELSSWHYQLVGAVDFANGRDALDVDLYDTTANEVAAIHDNGGYAIAYMNCGAWQPNKPDSSSYPASVIGKEPMKGWPEERWLDIRQIEILRPIVRRKMQLAKSKGFDAVEPDNMDGYSNTKEFGLTARHQLAFNRMVAFEAQSLGLAVFLKNCTSLVEELSADFDGAVVEEAFRYHEASEYQPFRDRGKPVFEIEYRRFTRANVSEAVSRKFNCIQGVLALDRATKQITKF